jgi:hypothetical protein
MENQFRVELLSIDWLATLPEEEDRCAHGKVLVVLGDTVLSDAQSSEWTVSAAALCLLRTLTGNHTLKAPVGDQLLPCCGFTMLPSPINDDVFICGCPNGVDWWVEHEQGAVRLTAPNGTSVLLPSAQYQKQVLGFADAVEQYYQRSKPKTIPADADDAAGYALFWTEWHRRRGQFL